MWMAHTVIAPFRQGLSVQDRVYRLGAHLLNGVVGDHDDRVGVGEPHVAHVAVLLQQLPVVARHVLRACTQPVRSSHGAQLQENRAACASSLGG